MKQQANPHLSATDEHALGQFEQTLREQGGFAFASERSYLSELRHFITWDEAHKAEQPVDAQGESGFDPQAIPTLTRYLTYLQKAQKQSPVSVNCAFISLKRYFSWAIRNHFIPSDPSGAVKLVGEVGTASRQFDDQEEHALFASVTKGGTLRDRAFIVFLLLIGLRAREVCQIRRDQVKLGKRSSLLEVIGKCNKYREVPLNATVRKVLEEYLSTLSPETRFLFPPGKTIEALSERAWAISSKNMRTPQNCSL